MTTRPRKPWRVVLDTPEGSRPEVTFTSEAKTYEYVVPERQKAERGESEVTAIRVYQWEGGRWWHFETVTPGELA